MKWTRCSDIAAISGLLIAPEGIEIVFAGRAGIRMMLLIAPEGIEISVAEIGEWRVDDS